MKRIYLFAVAVMFTIAASAQVQVGIRAGITASDLRISDDFGGSSDDIGSRLGFNIGVVADIPLIRDHFYIQPGLYLTQKGAEADDGYYDDWEDVDYYYEDKYTPLYLEIPILLSGRVNISPSIQLQVNVGPYFAFGVGGKYKSTEQESDFHPDGVIYSEYSESHNFFGDGDDACGYNRFDCGLSMGGGFLFGKHYYIGFQYELGLTNLYPSEWGGSMKNRTSVISIGYNF